MRRLVRPICPNPSALASGDYKHPINKDALRRSTFDKCMYCESKISHVDFAHVEHIKPKAADKFPHLEFAWDNHGYCCPKCNNIKSSKYDQGTPFIDPYTDNPEDHITFFGWISFPKQGSERGEITIKEIDLNRVELLERRKERIDKIACAINAAFRTQNQVLKNSAISVLKQEASPDKEYSLAIQHLLEAHRI